MPGIFDNKYFNAEVFGKYVDQIKRDRDNPLLKSPAITTNTNIANMMKDQTGGNLVTIPFKGLIGGKPLNYDGQTDIEAQTTSTYKQTRVVIGRANAWTEKDFAYDITGGHDEMENIASQIIDYWDDVKQDTLLLILEGIFKMTAAKDKEFVTAHTYEDKNFDVTTLNTALQQSVGSLKNNFALAIMHSRVATDLENLNLIKYLRYTDANGVERDLTLGTLNGRAVIIDDTVPVNGDKYTTYVLGTGAIEYTPVGAKVPYETDRDPKVNGGEDTLYSRDRFCFAPYGISFTAKNMATLSPTDDELKDGSNWEVVKDPKGNTISLKTIPIARIITDQSVQVEAEAPQQ